MSSSSRREFLQTGLTTSVASSLFVAGTTQAVAKEANERIRMGFVGIGGRCKDLIRGFMERSDCEVVSLCDVDERRLPGMVEEVADKTGKRPESLNDYRRILEDQSINVVVIATPDHWHCPLTVFSCQAGKDVYVEKPLSYNIWEGRKAVEAARKYNRVVQVGTQNRSGTYNLNAQDYIQSGKLGRIPLVKVFNMKPGKPFFMPQDTPAPEGVDYDRWLGPRPSRPFNKGHFHSSWHCHWEYSGGDVANDGIHQLDLARMLTGLGVPDRVHCTGGNFAFEKNDNETPDTQIATFDYEDCRMVYEQIKYGDTIRKTPGSIRNGDEFPYWMQNSTRIELYGTKGMMVVGRMGGGWQVFEKTYQNKPSVLEQEYGRYPDPEHRQNFIDSLRERKKPNADVEIGHESACLFHMANISYRLGGVALDFDRKTEQFTNSDEANKYLKAEQRKEYAIPEEV